VRLNLSIDTDPQQQAAASPLMLVARSLLRLPSSLTMLKRCAFALMFAVLVGLVIWGGDVIGDRRYEVNVVGVAPLYSLPPHAYPRSNPLVETLRQGEHLRVLRVRYGKRL
jgi:hypothetical protein